MSEKVYASMEPRPFSRGDYASGEISGVLGSMLQWSRDLSVAETGTARPATIQSRSGRS